MRAVFAEKQSLKGVENFFTDALLYQEANKVAKEPLLEDDDSDNEADSEPEEDTPATFAFKPIAAYLNEPECCWPKVTITRFYDFDDNKTYVVI